MIASSLTVARDGAALGASVCVAVYGLLQIDSGLIRQGEGPGENICEFVLLLSCGSLPEGLSELPDFFGQPGNGCGYSSIPIPLAVGLLHGSLELTDEHVVLLLLGGS